MAFLLADSESPIKPRHLSVSSPFSPYTWRDKFDNSYAMQKTLLAPEASKINICHIDGEKKMPTLIGP